MLRGVEIWPLVNMDTHLDVNIMQREDMQFRGEHASTSPLPGAIILRIFRDVFMILLFPN